MSIIVEKPKRYNYWHPVIAVLVIAGILILWPHLAPRPFSPLAFEILGFEGDVQVYDLQSRSWRVPKRGEEFKTSQKLKTGADGMVNFQVENEIHMRLKENSELKNEESRVRGKQEIYKLRLTQGVLLGATTRQFERKQTADQSILQILTRDYIANIHGAIFRVQATAQQGADNKVGVLRGFVEVSKPSPFFQSKGVRIRGLEESSVVGGVVQPATRVNTESWGLMKESYELLEKSAVMEAEQIDLSKSAGSFFNYVFDHGTFFTPKVGFSSREFFKDPDSGEVFLETQYDVFPAGSFCGVYIKTRDFDISKYSGLSFEVRRNPEEGSPDSFFIELKAKGNVVRRYAPKTFEQTWKRMAFDFRAKKSVIVNEVVFVFTNSRVGEAKKGVLEFRHMDLIPLPVAAVAAPASEVKAVSAPAASEVKTVSTTPATPVAPLAAAPLVSSKTAAPVADSSLAVPKEVPLE